MKHFKALSALLSYPEPELLDALPEIRLVLAEADLAGHTAPLLAELEADELVALQEKYVLVFDRNPSHSLHLFEHIHGEDRARGQAMVDLMEEYKAHGYEMVSSELPDYLPLFLEFLSQTDADEAARLLSDAVHVVAHVADRLREHGSVYAGVLDAVVALSPVAPEPLTVPPVRDMDEALETFGPGVDGVEPLLTPTLRPQIAPVNFYPQRPRA
ncbi:nitrate reductase molybdenum cofactor assembly chaperone [Pseudogulbenkiania sp. MAI-1]|uniref:nitrate reductase molybdenum cofactor assembly chaperone n=1 Tax=Pseudogulbenkiania sp. MAI-1 TaxID=990370 RepID=UPI00045E7761|nr:nitrate reductase molybdenum cofactor assembly chaperone [Pseudogulbenkiania sp. MAI-1]